MSARRSKPGGFYRESLRPLQEAAPRADVAELRRRLIEAIRKRPGELHLLLQASRVMLQAEAVERRSGAGRTEEMVANFERALDAMGKQLLPQERVGD